VTWDVPFNLATFQGCEQKYMTQAVAEGHISGDGPFSRRCQDLLAELTASRACLLTTSCTHALDLSALLLDLQPGDEVIVPAFTFSSTANAFVLRGCKPVFCDIRPDTLNLDERLLESLITPRTKVVVTVHYGGVGCEMDAILTIASRHRLAVVEDNAQGLFGRYRGRPLGSFGDMSAVSFHETKNITCGEGGALMLNRKDLLERAEILREKGTDRSRFFRGQVDKYTWVDLGSSFLPSDILAAFLLGQLEQRSAIQEKRKESWNGYYRELGSWASAYGVKLPEVPPHCEQAFHLFYLVMPDQASRDSLIDHLGARSILAVFHYLPLHTSPMGSRFGGRHGSCPVTESVSPRLLRLPLYAGLEPAQRAKVVEAVTSFVV
jgi:dTDP-4-amino-4,6-dideoxygalactose transaminase